MTSRIPLLAVAFALLAGACSASSSTTATTTPPEAPATTAAATATVVPSTLAPTPTTPTTLSPTVALPAEADSFGYRIEFDAVVSERGSTDILYSSLIDGVIVADSDAFESREWFGPQLVREEAYVVIGNGGWVKEDRKPWRELDAIDVLGIKSSTVTPTDFAAVYDVVNELEWQVRPYDGGVARVYRLPSDRADDLGVWLPDIVSQDLFGVEEYELELWIDAESEYVVLMDLQARGPESMLSDGAITESGGGDLELAVVYEFFDINSTQTTAPSAPTIVPSDAPDGFYLFEADEFGFSLNAPLDWTLFPPESFDGYEIPFAAAPSIDVPNDSYFSVAIEDLSDSQGLRVAEYAELNLRFITPFDGEVEIVTSEQVDFSGMPGWLTVANIAGPDESFTVRTVTVIDSSLGYSIEFYSWDDWYEVDIEAAQEMFDSFELFDPAGSST